MASAKSALTNKRQRLSTGAWLSVAPSSESGFLLDAEIAPAAVDRVARAGEVPDGLRARLAEALRLLVIMLREIMSDREGPALGRRTRPQLVSALKKSLRDCRVGPAVPLPDWLISELMSLEADRLISGRFGLKRPLVGLSPQELQEIPRLTAKARSRVEQSLDNPPAMAEVLKDAITHLRSKPKTNQEHYASKSANRPDKQVVVDWAFDFWTNELGREARVTKRLVAFTDVVLRLCGIEMDEPAVRKQLDEARRQLAARD